MRSRAEDGGGNWGGGEDAYAHAEGSAKVIEDDPGAGIALVVHREGLCGCRDGGGGFEVCRRWGGRRMGTCGGSLSSVGCGDKGDERASNFEGPENLVGSFGRNPASWWYDRMWGPTSGGRRPPAWGYRQERVNGRSRPWAVDLRSLPSTAVSGSHRGFNDSMITSPLLCYISHTSSYNHIYILHHPTLNYTSRRAPKRRLQPPDPRPTRP